MKKNDRRIFQKATRNIVKITGNTTYGLRQCVDNKILKTSNHANRLKAYHDQQERRLQHNELPIHNIGTNEIRKINKVNCY